MRLTGGDGCSIALRPVRYAHGSPPAMVGTNDWDANWLVVHGEARAADGSWSFSDPCMTTWEAAALGDWLRAAASGDAAVRPEDECDELFLEPNLAFAVAKRDGGRVVVRVGLGHESAPPWLAGDDRYDLGAYALRLDLSPADLLAADEEWRRELEPFPPR